MKKISKISSFKKLTVSCFYFCFFLNSFLADQIQIIQKLGSQCPAGFYTSGGFCKSYKNNKRKAILNKNKERCPTGFFSSGKYYCLSYQKF